MKACCEFSRKVQINQIQKKPLIIKIEANEEERLALTQRFSIPQLHSLFCKYELKYFHGRQVRAVGELKASITQNCVVSLEDFNVSINESFELHFITNDKLTAELEDIEDPDVIPYEGDEIDLGEVTAEQLALFLDPYPHKENTDNYLIFKHNNEIDVVDEGLKKNPFKVLEQLKNLSSDKKK